MNHLSLSTPMAHRSPLKITRTPIVLSRSLYATPSAPLPAQPPTSRTVGMADPKSIQKVKEISEQMVDEQLKQCLNALTAKHKNQTSFLHTQKEQNKIQFQRMIDLELQNDQSALERHHVNKVMEMSQQAAQLKLQLESEAQQREFQFKQAQLDALTAVLHKQGGLSLLPATRVNSAEVLEGTEDDQPVVNEDQLVEQPAQTSPQRRIMDSLDSLNSLASNNSYRSQAFRSRTDSAPSHAEELSPARAVHGAERQLTFINQRPTEEVHAVALGFVHPHVDFTGLNIPRF